jgi:hypothetical protein
MVYKGKECTNYAASGGGAFFRYHCGKIINLEESLGLSNIKISLQVRILYDLLLEYLREYRFEYDSSDY